MPVSAGVGEWGKRCIRALQKEDLLGFFASQDDLGRNEIWGAQADWMRCSQSLKASLFGGAVKDDEDI